MHLIEDNTELETIKERRQGFLVNVWPGVEAKVHNLENPCWFAQHHLSAESSYPTYFAETQQELEQHPWGNEELKLCSKCYP